MKLKLALLLTLASIGFHAYLAYHYYGLNFGFAAGDALCNLSAAFDCDTVAASSYSALMGVPMALWGAATNVVLLLMLFGSLIRWSPETERHDALTTALAAFIAVVSVVMGFVSTLLIGTFCLFCIIVYFLSFGTLWLVYKSLSPGRKPILSHLLEIPTKAQSYIALILLIPALGFGVNHSMATRYGASRLKYVVQDSIQNWKLAPSFTFEAPPSLKFGADNPKMTITEFADFLCGHCKNAGPSIKAFVKSNPDVQMHFYSFPLDGQCNEAVTRPHGVPCYLAKSVYCAEKIANMGWFYHDEVFAAQDALLSKMNMPFTEEKIQDISKRAKVDFSDLAQCIEDEETNLAIRAQAKAGENAKVRGTPAIFVNGRLLERGQLIQVLDAAKKLL